MVERSLSMREVPGSIPGFSMTHFFSFFVHIHIHFSIPYTLPKGVKLWETVYLFCTMRLMFLRATNWISGSADSRVTITIFIGEKNSRHRTSQIIHFLSLHFHTT